MNCRLWLFVELFGCWFVGGIPLTIISGFQPSYRGVAFFPNASLRYTLGWIITLFQGSFSIVNCQWLFFRYMIRRVPRITINNWPLTIELCYAGYTVSEHRGTSPQPPPSKGGRAEASYLIFRPASVAKACEAHEALTFWLLLGQAKSNGKRFFASLWMTN